MNCFGGKGDLYSRGVNHRESKLKTILEFPFPPIAKERARVTRFGTYTPARTKEFERQVKSHLDDCLQADVLRLL